MTIATIIVNVVCFAWIGVMLFIVWRKKKALKKDAEKRIQEYEENEKQDKDGKKSR